MMTRNKLSAVVLAGMCVMGAAATAAAAPVFYDVTLDTTALVGAIDGPFSLNFQLNDGGGEATNSATLSDFQFGAGGGGVGSPTLIGGATGDLSSTVTLTDADGSFFNSFTQEFDPGTVLRFSILLTTELEPGGIPDQLSMGILAAGVGLPTEFFDAFFTIDVSSIDPAIQSFASDPSSGLTIGAPAVTPVPEPASLMLFGSGLVLAGFGRRRIRR
jgi:hypothetical protein